MAEGTVRRYHSELTANTYVFAKAVPLKTGREGGREIVI